MSFFAEPASQQSVIVHVGRSLDMRSASEFKKLCYEKICEGGRNFILDFCETRTLDSTGLGSIFWLYRQVSPLDGIVAFASTSPAVNVVVQVTNIEEVFPRYPSVEEACSALG